MRSVLVWYCDVVLWCRAPSEWQFSSFRLLPTVTPPCPRRPSPRHPRRAAAAAASPARPAGLRTPPRRSGIGRWAWPRCRSDVSGGRDLLKPPAVAPRLHIWLWALPETQCASNIHYHSRREMTMMTMMTKIMWNAVTSRIQSWMVHLDDECHRMLLSPHHHHLWKCQFDEYM